MDLTRRGLLGGFGALAGAGLVPGAGVAASEPVGRKIPSSGERVPLVGLGSWITFNVGRDPKLRDACAEVIAAFFAAGGRMIDSSPMYGSSQATIGYGLAKGGFEKSVFSAEKVWTSSAANGPDQIARTREFWRVDAFDLMQIHNLLAWEDHLPKLLQMKAEGRLRYVGITTSHGRRHGDLAAILAKHPLDFVQLTYNAIDREAETRLLPLAREKGIAVIVNRPFRRKALIRHVAPHPLPPWATETGARNWSQFLLRFVLSHPAVTCAIPATTRVDHVRENVAAGLVPDLPDARLRERMAAYVRDL